MSLNVPPGADAAKEALGAGELRELAEWGPPHGLVSVCFDTDPGDRSEGWRIELRHRLGRLEIPDDDPDRHERRKALAAAVERVLGRFPAERSSPGGRTQLGYVELGKDGRERWWTSQVPVHRFDAELRDKPYLRPAVEVADASRRLAVAVLSSERVRLIQLVAGRSAEVGEFELETFELDWRERKAQRVVDPSRGHGASASGKDQYGQRLDANRERFIAEAAEQVGKWLADHAMADLLVAGEPSLAKRFVASVGEGPAVRSIDAADLISEPEHLIAQRVLAELPALEGERRRDLVSRALDGARAGGNGSLGVEETAQTLAEGRVAQLLIDAERDLGARPELVAPLGITEEAAADIAEWMIETAILTSADVIPLRGEAAESLAEQEGVAAVLRY